MPSLTSQHNATCIQGPIQKWLGANGGDWDRDAVGAEIERRRREHRGTEDAERVVCGEGCPPPHQEKGLGRRLCPLPGICF